MPYMIRQINSKHHVYKKGANGQPTGAALGKHKTRSAAVDQLRALYANEERNKAAASEDEIEIDQKLFGPAWSPLIDSSLPAAPSYNEAELDDGDNYVGSPMTPKLDQDDPRVEYDPLGGSKTAACANCAFFDADDSLCRLVSGDIVATGWCELWLRDLSPAEQDAEDAIKVQTIPATKARTGNLLDVVRTAIKQALRANDPAEQPDQDPPIQAFKTFGPDNQYWVAFYSNNAQDRDGEWFSTASHDKAISRIDQGLAPMPKLDYWHSKAYHGEAFWLGREGHVCIAVGEFWPDEFSQAMKQYYVNSAPGDELVSFGYVYPRSALVDGVYNDYTPFEISPLPATVAANPYTGFANLEEFKTMTISTEKRKELARRLGPQLADQLLATAGTKSAAMEDVQTSFKNVEESEDLAAQVKSLREAVIMMATGQKDGVAGPDPKTSPKKPTKRMGQPSDPEEQNDGKDQVDADEEDLDNMGSPKSIDRSAAKQIARLEQRVKQLARALKAKNDPDDDGDDDSEDDDDMEDNEPPTNKKSRRYQERGLKELATGYKAINDALTQVATALNAINTKQARLEAGINQLGAEIYNPTPASRSPYSVVPPDDAAMSELAARMNSKSINNAPPNGAQAEAMAIEDMASFIGLPTQFAQQGRRG